MTDKKFPIDYQEVVISVSRKVAKLILDETVDLAPTKRWLIVSRIINNIFQNHYRMTFLEASERVDQEERKFVEENGNDK